MAQGSNVLKIEISPELDRQLTALEKAMERPRDWIIGKAIEDWLSVNAWQIEEIKTALAAADAGEFASDEEVEAVFRRLNIAR
jgi:RHH-type transcriptional regulator, rel operon repressor / antitoxin RelB